VGEGCRESLVAVGVSCANFTDLLRPNGSLCTFSYETLLQLSESSVDVGWWNTQS
jgi:hypothetical protein